MDWTLSGERSEAGTKAEVRSATLENIEDQLSGTAEAGIRAVARNVIWLNVVKKRTSLYAAVGIGECWILGVWREESMRFKAQ